MTVFNLSSASRDYLSQPLFFGEKLGIARYDKLKQPYFDYLVDQQLGFFWRPEEINLSKDTNDFKQLTEGQKEIFTLNLSRQIVLDSVQGRAPVEVLLPVCSSPELENWIITWSFFETIHSRSYTHIIRNIYPNPSIVFDQILDIEPIVDMAKDLSKHYDMFSSSSLSNDLFEKKKKLWMCLHAINALEGLRFYVSFACSWAFAEIKTMEGNAKIIKLICRDENLHLSSTQQLLKILAKTDSDFGEIKKLMIDDCLKLYQQVAEQEKQWASYLFGDPEKPRTMIGLSEQILHQYVEWLANKRASSINLPAPYPEIDQTNPLPWTEKWIRGENVQDAPQEVNLSSYIVGGIKHDFNDEKFGALEKMFR